jgi:hypothetical protein
MEKNEFGGSIFSREDVIRILGMVRVTEQPKTSAINLNALFEDLNYIIDEIASIDIDKGSLEFSINYSNEVELDSYELERDEAKEAVERIIKKLERNEYEPEVEEEDEEEEEKVQRTQFTISADLVNLQRGEEVK